MGFVEDPQGGRKRREPQFLSISSSSDDSLQLGPYTPGTLARSPLPPKLRAAHLVIEEGTFEDEQCVPSLCRPSFVTRRYRHSESFQPSPVSTDSAGTSEGFGRPRNHSPSAPSPTDGSGRRALTLDDAKEEFIAQGMHLLLAACSRALTLSEQRVSPVSFFCAYNGPYSTSCRLSLSLCRISLRRHSLNLTTSRL